MPKINILSSMGIAAALLASSSAPATTITLTFRAAHFSHPLKIDNAYFPLIPGTIYTYKATTTDGCERDIMTVTNQTKATGPVTSRVVHDVVYEGPSCSGPWMKAEDTSDYYAQDDSGNVWYTGEDSFNCDETGHCVRDDGSWLTGVNGGTPGIVMLADPRSGDQYRQEFSPGHAEDEAQVMEVGATAKSTRPDAYRPSYDNSITTKEWSGLELGDVEQKAYAPGIGNVSTTEHHGAVVNEELVAVRSP